MDERRIIVVSTGRNCAAYALECFESIEAQTYRNYEVVVVDDASTDGAAAIVDSWCRERPNWHAILRLDRRGTLRNQWDAIHHLPALPGDVVVWVDTDDKLAHHRVFQRVVRAYDEGALVTYGSYRPFPKTDPSARTCAPAQPYPPDVIAGNRYRDHVFEPGGGIIWNHLRTVSRSILDKLTEDDMRGADGEFYRTAPDGAIMFPALELAQGAIEFIPDVLLLYRCNNPNSEWRVAAKQVNDDHHHQLRVRKPKTEGVNR